LAGVPIQFQEIYGDFLVYMETSCIFAGNKPNIYTMKSPNIQAIRKQLPHGGLTEIANRTGLSLRTVSDFFSHGWYPEHTTTILTEAVAIIEGRYPDDELMEKVNELGLTGGGAFIRKKRKHTSSESEGGSGNVIIVLGIIAILAYFIFAPVRNFIKGLFTKTIA